LGGLRLEAIPGKKSMTPHLSHWVWWFTSVIPAIARSINRGTVVQSDLGINVRPYS
jgi:hypothetical protein